MLEKLNVCAHVDTEDDSEWLKDNNDGGYDTMTEEEIIASCTSIADGEGEDDDDEEGATTPQHRTTHSDAANQLTNIMAYLERQHDTTPAELFASDKAFTRPCFI